MAEKHNEAVSDNEDEEEAVYSLKEVLDVQEVMLVQADAVLGASDDKNCTYDKGYLKRQALYACLTCTPEAKDNVANCAGVCLACCLHCHEGHELIELYTKRNFRCDCGNSKFANFTCKLDNTKSETNVLNCYNHNYWGLYCTCLRPYPDAEDTELDIMIQCIMCEDWYHERHLGSLVEESFVEMICDKCVEEHEFILHYDGLAVKIVEPQSEDMAVDVVGEKTEDIQTKDADAVEDVSKLGDQAESDTPVEINAKPKEDENPLVRGIDTTQKESLSAIMECKMPQEKSQKICAKYFADISWRQQLCTCVKCLQMYENGKVMYLIDPQDPVQEYERKGIAKAEENRKKRQEDLFKTMDRVPLLEMIAGYQELKEKLGEFFSEFAKNKRVIREQDVKEFFEEMKANKRQKTGENQYYCR